MFLVTVFSFYEWQPTRQMFDLIFLGCMPFSFILGAMVRKQGGDIYYSICCYDWSIKAGISWSMIQVLNGSVSFSCLTTVEQATGLPIVILVLHNSTLIVT